MFTPIHLLPLYSVAKQQEYEDRWNSEPGRALHDKIMGMIRDGAGEDFLQWEFEHGRLGFLEDMWDLKGFSIFGEKFALPGGDTFEAIDFSFAQFYHSQFGYAVFNSNFSFTRIYNCQFVNCIFSFTGFYAATLEKVQFINCEFFERNSFTNCDFKDVEFKGCFLPENIFFDCRFDESTEVRDLAVAPTRMKPSGLRLENSQLAGIYRGIKDGFTAGGVIQKTSSYYFRQMQSMTRFNSKGIGAKSSGYALEYLTGYGMKPIRVLIAMLVVFVFSLVWFSLKVGFSDALLLVSGALFTFGANADLLKKVGLFSKLVYAATAFFGVSLVALFITVLANRWLRER